MSTILAIVNASAFITIITYIWLNTDAFVEYIRTIGTSKLIERFQLNEFDDAREMEDARYTYPDFLYSRYPSIKTKIISCPICLPIYLALFISLFSGLITLFPIVLLLSWTMYFLFLKLVD